MINELIDYIYRSIKLDRSLYGNPKNFHELSIYYAVIIIILDGIAGAVAVSSFYKSNIMLSGLTAIIGWVVWAILIYIIGIKLFPDPDTKADLRKVLIIVGFAHSPGLLRILGIIPGLAIPIIFFTQFWIFASLIIGVKEGLNFKSNFKSLGVILIAFLIIAIISVSYLTSVLENLPQV